MADRFPRLFSFAYKEDLSVEEVIQSESFSSPFTPLSAQAREEFQLLQHICEENINGTSDFDSRSFVWGNSYTPAKFYKFMFQCIPKDAALTKKCGGLADCSRSEFSVGS